MQGPHIHGAVHVRALCIALRQSPTRDASINAGAEGAISAIAVSNKNPAHRVYIGTSANRLFRIDDAHTGSPKMVSLTRPFGSSANVNCIAVDPDNADHVDRITG